MLPQRQEETAETHVQSNPRVKESGTGNVAFETELILRAISFCGNKAFKTMRINFGAKFYFGGNVAFKTTDTICGERFSLRKYSIRNIAHLFFVLFELM